MSKLYATFANQAAAQAWIDSVDAALGYPNARAQTYSVAIKHTTNNTYSVLTDDDAGGLLDGLTRISRAQAITDGYLPVPVIG